MGRLRAAVHIERIADATQEVGTASVTPLAGAHRAQGPEFLGNHRQLCLPQVIQHLVSLRAHLHELGVRRPVRHLDYLCLNARCTVAAGAVPGDVQDNGIVTIGARLQNAGPVHYFVYDVVVVAREDNREVHSPRCVLVLWLVEVAERHHDVATLLLKLRFVLRHRFPGILDSGAPESTGLIERARAAKHANEADLAHVAAVRTSDPNHLCILLALGVREGFVGGHVRVDPNALVLHLSLQHVMMGQVILVIAPGQNIDRCGIQHVHHSHALVNGAEQVGHEEVTCEAGKRLRAAEDTPALPSKLQTLGLNQSSQAREVVQHIDIGDLHHAKSRLGAVVDTTANQRWLILGGTEKRIEQRLVLHSAVRIEKGGDKSVDLLIRVVRLQRLEQPDEVRALDGTVAFSVPFLKSTSHLIRPARHVARMAAD
mmetsp:Transcript_17887/g.38005  ORF Transcript_17887/g.38005 Transcript_17887/m.38005 type:complete len:428 (+) Transcript_17887:828-2111(+)